MQKSMMISCFFTAPFLLGTGCDVSSTPEDSIGALEARSWGCEEVTGDPGCYGAREVIVNPTKSGGGFTNLPLKSDTATAKQFCLEEGYAFYNDVPPSVAVHSTAYLGDIALYSTGQNLWMWSPSGQTLREVFSFVYCSDAEGFTRPKKNGRLLRANFETATRFCHEKGKSLTTYAVMNTTEQTAVWTSDNTWGHNPAGSAKEYVEFITCL